MRLVPATAAFLAVLLVADTPPRAADRATASPVLRHSEKRTDRILKSRAGGDVTYEVATRTTAKTTLALPVDLTPTQLGDLDDTWGLSLGDTGGSTYASLHRSSYGGYGYGGFDFSDALGSEYCDWSPGRTKAKWVFHDDYYGTAATLTVTAKWNATTLKVTAVSRTPVFTDGYDFPADPFPVPVDAVAGFGDLDGASGSAFYYRFEGDFDGTASRDDVTVGKPGYEYYYTLWKAAVSGQLQGTSYTPYTYTYAK